MIIQNYNSVVEAISKTANEVDRKPDDINLIAVSKTHFEDKIRPVLEAGHRIFGENRLQESLEKWPALKQDFPDVELHLIGGLQTNKVAEAVALFDVIEAVDRPKLATKLAEEMDKTGKRPDCYIQVNTGNEDQKSGINPKDVDAFIKMCIDDLNLPIKGLMCIPPFDEEPSPHFALLRKNADRNGLKVLSMGMSSDYEIAIGQGATHVRVGSAIFGNRNYA
ncbi:MAG: YggS family pyridoxal phosphate-dependent enzyme [Alphaproteobacteria bacterium]|nr:YggS family pyridoxal phosphate-dependent enzyme [Alphaproteobacteria bacterium]